MARPPRIKGFSYCGLHRYFLTWCTYNRQHVFVAPPPVDLVLFHIRRVAAAEEFSNMAYCFMPNHLHLLVEGQRDDSDLQRFVHRVKLQSGFQFSRQFGCRLWQEGYHEYVLRDGESTREKARYILNNPVRAGLVRSPEDYPYSGSDEFTMQELLAGL